MTWSLPQKKGRKVRFTKPAENGNFCLRISVYLFWWPGTESNRRRQPFQGCALPTELPGQVLLLARLPVEGACRQLQHETDDYSNDAGIPPNSIGLLDADTQESRDFACYV